MKKSLVYLFLTFHAILCLSQNCNLYGEHYIYIKLEAERKNNYPIIFSAVTKMDSINVCLSNLDCFVGSIYSSCSFTPLSSSSFIKAFQIVYGDTMKIYDLQRQFMIDFFSHVDQFKREITLELKTGEKIYVEYSDVTGVFYRGDKSFIEESIISIGLPEEYITAPVIIPIALTDYRVPERELLFNSHK